MLVKLLVGRPLTTLLQVAPPSVVRKTPAAEACDTMMILGFDLEMAIAEMLRSVRHVEPSTVVVGSGTHESPASVDFQRRYDGV